MHAEEAYVNQFPVSAVVYANVVFAVATLRERHELAILVEAQPTVRVLRVLDIVYALVYERPNGQSQLEVRDSNHLASVGNPTRESQSSETLKIWFIRNSLVYLVDLAVPLIVVEALNVDKPFLVYSA